MTKNRKDLTPRRVSKMMPRAKPQITANIKVVIRVRPPNEHEQGECQRYIVKCRESNVLTFDPEEDSTPFFFHGVKQKRRDLLKKQNKNLQFVFDRVFSETASNYEVFCNSTKDLINILMDGCNCSVFAYGATGAGKTYTMLGKPDAPGITVLTIGELFARKEQLSEDRDFELYVTYLEVYNENVRDLLKNSNQSLQLREDSQFGVQAAGLTHKKITNADELFLLLEQGNKNRTQHPTDSNAESSRSHAVFQVYLKMTVKQTGQRIVAKLSMIDLAGSERGAATGCKGIRFTEGANINRSLLALGNCINGLADGLRHVPYRDSKLTRILKDSLGGNCHTVMIANVSPSSLTFEDTYNTLKYATRAKKIKANVKKNIMTSDKSSAEYIKIIEDLNEEVRRLKEENSKLRGCRSMSQVSESDRDDGTTTTTSSELINKTFTSVSGTNSDAIVSTCIDELSNEEQQVKSLYENLSNLEDRKHTFLKKKYLLQIRIDLKDEQKARLSGEFSNDHGRKRIIQTMHRLRRQAEPYDNELLEIEEKINDTKLRIDKLLRDNPELKHITDIEQNKIDKLFAINDKDTLDSIVKIQTNELRSRGEFVEKSSKMVRSLYALLNHYKLITPELSTSVDDLFSMNNQDNVRFEDDGDSGLSTTTSSASSSATEVEQQKDELRTMKRKLETDNDLDSTFVQTKSRGATESTLFKEFQPTPNKRLAKCVRSSPRIKNLKENRTISLSNTVRRPVGTMGTSSRFPSKTFAVQQAPKRPFR